MDYDFKVLLQVGASQSRPWPKELPIPEVGDKMSAQMDGSVFMGTVVGREWGIGPAPHTETPTAVLVIIVETPQPPKPGRASVEPLRI